MTSPVLRSVRVANFFARFPRVCSAHCMLARIASNQTGVPQR
jgi:hypothetical protein